jgi:hypothetical protein
VTEKKGIALATVTNPSERQHAQLSRRVQTWERDLKQAKEAGMARKRKKRRKKGEARKRQEEAERKQGT